jgi:Zn-dependent protease
VLWALGQPAAAAGLASAFLIGLGLRVVAQRCCIRWLGSPLGSAVPVRPTPRTDVDPAGAMAVLFGGTGWGRGTPAGFTDRRRCALVLAAGPLAPLAVSQVALASFGRAYPAQRAALALNRPSDVLRGVVAPAMAEQLILSVAVGLLCFGLLALVPVPPLDGFRLVRLAWDELPVAPTPLADRLGVVALLILLMVPVGSRPPLLAVLDFVGAPLLRLWT